MNQEIGASGVKPLCLMASSFNLATASGAKPAQTDWGSTKPNRFRGPGFPSISAQLGKEIPDVKGETFEIGRDAYSLLNRSNFGIPNADVYKGSTQGTLTADVSVSTGIYGTGQGRFVSSRVLVVYGKFTF